jgi:hypothetical protein
MHNAHAHAHVKPNKSFASLFGGSQAATVSLETATALPTTPCEVTALVKSKIIQIDCRRRGPRYIYPSKDVLKEHARIAPQDYKDCPSTNRDQAQLAKMIPIRFNRDFEFPRDFVATCDLCDSYFLSPSLPFVCDNERECQSYKMPVPSHNAFCDLPLEMKKLLLNDVDSPFVIVERVDSEGNIVHEIYERICWHCARDFQVKCPKKYVITLKDTVSTKDHLTMIKYRQSFEKPKQALAKNTPQKASTTIYFAGEPNSGKSTLLNRIRQISTRTGVIYDQFLFEVFADKSLIVRSQLPQFSIGEQLIIDIQGEQQIIETDNVVYVINGSSFRHNGQINSFELFLNNIPKKLVDDGRLHVLVNNVSDKSKFSSVVLAEILKVVPFERVHFLAAPHVPFSTTLDFNERLQVITSAKAFIQDYKKLFACF